MEQTEALKLTAEKRKVFGKQVKQFRSEGLLPAVVYGRAFDAIPLLIDGKEFRQVYSMASGNQLIGLKVKGIRKPEKALVREVQRDPVSRAILHVDFYRVSMTERITTEIPITLVGESLLAAGANAIMLYGVSSIEIQCLPEDLPESIEVDVSTLEEIGQAVFVRDLPLGENIELLTDPEEMVVRVSATREIDLGIEEEVEIEEIEGELAEGEVPEAAEGETPASETGEGDATAG